MAEEQAQGAAPEQKSSLKAKAILAGVVVVVLVMLWLFGVFVLPAWYSRRVGDLADGRLGFSGSLGFTIGLGCTLVPLLLIRSAWRLRRGTRRAVTLLVAALLIAAPNLVLLGIATGDSETAHNAERTLGTDAPWFRAWSLFGAIGGFGVFLVLAWLMFSRNRHKKKSRELEAATKGD